LVESFLRFSVQQLSVIAALLRAAGAGPVYPVALANTSGSGDDGQ
jgi:hypothetical protein